MKKDWFSQGELVCHCGREYAQHVVKGHKYYVYKKVEHLVQFVKTKFDQHDKIIILDYGCGTGEVCKILEKYFNNIVGCDTNESMLKVARLNSFQSNFYLLDENFSLPIADESVDVACMYGVLHHIPSKDEIDLVFDKIKRYLKKNAFLVIYEFNPLNPCSRYIVSTCKVDEGVHLDGFHKGIFPTTLYHWQIEKICKEHDFEVIKRDFILLFPPILKKLSIIEKMLQNYPFGNMSVTIAQKI